MGKIQKWNITLEDETVHTLRFEHKTLSRHITVTIDGEQFEIPTGERQEIFRLGDEQMIMQVQKNHRVTIRGPRGEEPEAKDE